MGRYNYTDVRDVYLRKFYNKRICESAQEFGKLLYRFDRARSYLLRGVILRTRISQPLLLFRQGETQRARQVMLIVADRDLLYLANHIHPEVFLRLWKSRWCRRIRYLALLIYHYPTGTGWLDVRLPERAEEIWPNDLTSFLDGTQLKEILLVAKLTQLKWGLQPREYIDANPLPHRRDVYGFVEFGPLRDKLIARDVIPPAEMVRIDESYSTCERQLRAIFPGYTIEFRWVVDLDYMII